MESITVRALENEFWPLEGVAFEQDNHEEQVSVICKVLGDSRLKGHVQLRFPLARNIDIEDMAAPLCLYCLKLTANIPALNQAFRGFGLVFTQDIDITGRLRVDVCGAQSFSFPITLV